MDFYNRFIEYLSHKCSHRLGHYLFSFFGVLGLFPVEVAISVFCIEILGWPYYIAFIMTSMYLIVYVLGISIGCSLFMRYYNAPDKIEQKLFSYLVRYKLGRFLVDWLKDNQEKYQRNWVMMVLYEIVYHGLMITFGIVPPLSKLAEFRIALYPRFSGFICVFLGMIIRGYGITYYGVNWLERIFS